jgi:hypothetical protein
MIECGIASDITDSQSAALRPRPLTKYDDRYAAAPVAAWGLGFLSTKPKPY